MLISLDIPDKYRNVLAAAIEEAGANTVGFLTAALVDAAYRRLGKPKARKLLEATADWSQRPGFYLTLTPDGKITEAPDNA